MTLSGIPGYKWAKSDVQFSGRAMLDPYGETRKIVLSTSHILYLYKFGVIGQKCHMTLIILASLQTSSTYALFCQVFTWRLATYVRKYLPCMRADPVPSVHSLTIVVNAINNQYETECQ